MADNKTGTLTLVCPLCDRREVFQADEIEEAIKRAEASYGPLPESQLIRAARAVMAGEDQTAPALCPTCRIVVRGMLEVLDGPGAPEDNEADDKPGPHGVFDCEKCDDQACQIRKAPHRAEAAGTPINRIGKA